MLKTCMLFLLTILFLFGLLMHIYGLIENDLICYSNEKMHFNLNQINIMYVM